MNNRHRQRSVSLSRVLSKLGYCSRAEAVRLIVAAKVKVNGRMIRNPAHRCSMEDDVVDVAGLAPRPKKNVYIVMHKPAGIVTTRSDELGRKTVYDILGDVGRWVFPVGRLDKDTSGLLLLTNDHQLGERLTNPKSRMPKTYVAELDAKFTDEAIRVFEKGMILDGAKLLPANVMRLDGRKIQLTIIEGKNRQIRKMCEAIGYDVVSLQRIRMGELHLEDLPPGAWRHLKIEEIRSLSAVPRKPARKFARRATPLVDRPGVLRK